MFARNETNQPKANQSNIDDKFLKNIIKDLKKIDDSYFLLDLEQQQGVILQAKNQFCLSEDTFLLACYAALEEAERGPFHKKIFDACAGSGVLGLIFALKMAKLTKQIIEGWGLEIAEKSLNILKLNYHEYARQFDFTPVKANLCLPKENWQIYELLDEQILAILKNSGNKKIQDILQIKSGGLQTNVEEKSLPPSNSVDLVLINPPYRTEKHALAPKSTLNMGKRAAFLHMEDDLSLYWQHIIPFLKANARIYLVFPFAGLNYLYNSLHKNGLIIHKMRAVYPSLNKASKIFFATIKKGKLSNDVRMEPPLIVRQANGDYTEEVSGWYNNLFRLSEN